MIVGWPSNESIECPPPDCLITTKFTNIYYIYYKQNSRQFQQAKWFFLVPLVPTVPVGTPSPDAPRRVNPSLDAERPNPIPTQSVGTRDDPLVPTGTVGTPSPDAPRRVNLPSLDAERPDPIPTQSVGTRKNEEDPLVPTVPVGTPPQTLRVESQPIHPHLFGPPAAGHPSQHNSAHWNTANALADRHIHASQDSGEYTPPSAPASPRP